MKPNKELARQLRNAGLGKLVDSPKLRSALGLPIRERRAPEGRAEVEAPQEPLISVIVPAYNVAAYLENAVGTVQSQTCRALEIVIVDDGSTDDTGEIADRIAQSDSRVRVIHKENAGLGAARNTGLLHTSAPFVAFVDSDDQLVPDAYEVMLASLDASGSDFAIGGVERFNSTVAWTPDWVKEVHDRDRIGSTAEQHPAVLWDVFVWNKLFRRRSWDTRVGLFPEGVLYEDQECTARLYVEGATFDSLEHTVYRWRMRDDGSSITQNKSSVEDLQQRILVARTVQKVIDGSSDRGLIDEWYAKLLGDDLYWYYREVPRADEEFFDALVECTRAFLAQASPEAIRATRFDRRMVMLAVARGTREHFDAVFSYFQDKGAHWEVQFVDDRAYGFAPFVLGIEDVLPQRDREVDLLELEPEATLLRQSFGDDGSMSFEGFALLPNVPPRLIDSVRVDLIPLVQEPNQAEAEEAVALPPAPIRLHAEFRADPDVDIHVRHSTLSYGAAGMVIELTAEHLARAVEAVEDGRIDGWQMRVSLGRAEHIWMTARIHVNGNGVLGRLGAGAITREGLRWRLERRGSSFCVIPHRVDFAVASAEIRGTSVAFDFSDFRTDHFGGAEESTELVVGASGSELVRFPAHRVSEGRLVASGDLPALAPIMKSNYAGLDVAVHRNGEAIGFLESDRTRHRAFGTDGYGLHVSRHGMLQIERYAQFAEVHRVDLLESGTLLRLTGVARFDRRQVRIGTPSFMLWHKTHTIHPSSLSYSEVDGAYTVDFHLTHEDIDGHRVFYAARSYSFGMVLPSGHRLPGSFTVLAGDAFADTLPFECSEGRARIGLRRRPSDGGLGVDILAPFVREERGVLAQNRLGARFELLRGDRARDAVLFESFGGAAVSDSPKAIDRVLARERPELERLWTVRNHSVAVPEGARAVLLYSKEWYEALETSRYLVNNNNFPHYFRKSPAQTYVQTWHGTPLKRVGNDVPAANLSLSYRALMRREGEQYWDYLLAQTPWAGRVLANAFGYVGPVLDQGYPRNDALVSNGADDRRQRVREFLGLGSSQRAVLYAPTWRDNLKAANGKYQRPEYLDTKLLHREFGRDVVVLMRGHTNNADSAGTATGPNAIDVSSYPDVNDLYLASDILVTDYSSVQFDYVNTGKPICYLVPDLELYRDAVRGFYFDLVEQAPGPIFRGTDELLEFLAAVPARPGPVPAGGAYGDFKQSFAPLDDGEASRRVVRGIFTR